MEHCHEADELFMPLRHSSVSSATHRNAHPHRLQQYVRLLSSVLLCGERVRYSVVAFNFAFGQTRYSCDSFAMQRSTIISPC
jgi:hypothetical protein